MNAPISSRVSGGCTTSIVVPDELEMRLRDVVDRVAAGLGESPEDCRRAVEIAVLQRGIEALKRDGSK